MVCSFKVKNCLRQGCILPSTLFNVYFSAVVASCQSNCAEAVVDIMFRHGRKLVRDMTAKLKLSMVRVTESSLLIVQQSVRSIQQP